MSYGWYLQLFKSDFHSFHRLELKRPSGGAAAKVDGSRVEPGPGCEGRVRRGEAPTTHWLLATFASLCCLALGAAFEMGGWKLRWWHWCDMAQVAVAAGRSHSAVLATRGVAALPSQQLLHHMTSCDITWPWNPFVLLLLYIFVVCFQHTRDEMNICPLCQGQSTLEPTQGGKSERREGWTSLFFFLFFFT